MAKAEAAAHAALLNVTLVYSPAARQLREWALALAPGTTLAQALAGSSLFEEFPELQKNQPQVGLWGRETPPDQALAEGDRIEIYRPLRADPKTARRERFSRQGAKSAGLFTKKRPGAKAGY